MTREQTPATADDALARATAALRQTPIPPGPAAELIASGQQIPFSRHHPRLARHPMIVVAASIGIAFLGVLVYLLSQQTSAVAFADVVQSINQTHTFTATIDAGASSGPSAVIHLFAKGAKLRTETTDSIAILDTDAGKALELVPSTHLATATPIHQTPYDLYEIFRDARMGGGRSIGEALIEGRKTRGFLVNLASPQSGPPLNCVMWVDPVTKLPVRVEIGPAVMNDLRFDVPLAESLFDTKAPPGYAVAAPGKIEPWDRRSYAGQVVDEEGKPVAGVEVEATLRVDTRSPGGFGFVGETVKSGEDGRFAIDDSAQRNDLYDNPIRLEFKHPDFVYARLEDMRLLPPEERVHLRVRLCKGSSVSGRVIDPTGRPVGEALVESVYGMPDFGKIRQDDVRNDYNKIVVTDSSGDFKLRGLATAPVILQVIKTGPGGTILTGQAKIDLQLSPKGTSQILAHPLELARGTIIHELFGMKLVDVDDDLRARLSLYPGDRVMILDPGPASDRLNVGELEPGDAFWMVGEVRIRDFDDFARNLLAACEAQHRTGQSDFMVRTVYDYTRAQGGGSNTQFMRLHMKDLAELQTVLVGRQETVTPR